MYFFFFSDEGSKSSNGNSADTEGDEESEIGGLEKSLDERRAAVDKLHHQPLTHRQEKNRKHDPNRYRLSWEYFKLIYAFSCAQKMKLKYVPQNIFT